MLEIKNLSKSYVARKKAVDNVSFNIKDGEIFAFIGHNGAGKTTAIKAIVGVLNFDEGEIILDGINLKDHPLAFKKKVAYIPDNPELYENLTAFQYLDFIANIYEVDRAQKEARIMKYAKILELDQVLGHQISSFSHGMKQKVAIISAFIREPKLLILDEPFVGLDPNASFKVKELFKEKSRDGMIIFFSTHILEVAEKLCDHVAIIKDGRLLVHGTMEEVKGNASLEDVFMGLN